MATMALKIGGKHIKSDLEVEQSEKMLNKNLDILS